ncbi:MAG: L-histidine N(alpha)-methyltransferase [Cytophagales bacterium]|nr:MAG: L-histidine N(alpha)-methyltransferase [Cytophagales bacterium]
MAIFGNSVSETVSESETLADEVWVGLQATPKRLSSRYLYDDEGSRLFQAIMHLPEYYLTRAEFEILTTHKQSILNLFRVANRPFSLIELGAGDGLKTKVLLDYFWNEQAQFNYRPVDISGGALDDLTQSVRSGWPQLSVMPIQAEYVSALRQLAEDDDRPDNERRVVLFLGSNIGNFGPAEAVAFYKQLSAQLQPGDLLLTGFDLQKHPAIVHAAYNDSQGLTRAFNLNLLRRINRELDADFDLLAFDHYETYLPETGEARSYLVSREAQTVTIAALGLTVPFERGEWIYTEMSRKFTRAQIEVLATQTGFRVVGWFTDERGYFVDAVYEKV